MYLIHSFLEQRRDAGTLVVGSYLLLTEGDLCCFESWETRSLLRTLGKVKQEKKPEDAGQVLNFLKLPVIKVSRVPECQCQC